MTVRFYGFGQVLGPGGAKHANLWHGPPFSWAAPANLTQCACRKASSKMVPRTPRERTVLVRTRLVARAVAWVSVLSFGLSACASLSLDTAFAGREGEDVYPEDGSAYDAGTESKFTRDGAGADVSANILSGSPLCNVFAAGAPCNPDTPATASAACALPSSSDSGTRDTGTDAGLSDASATVIDADTPPVDAAALVVACRVDSNGDGTFGPSCRFSGPGRDGVECMSGADCAAGFDCVGTPGRCRPYCCNYTCGNHSFCDIQATSGPPNLNIPVCSPVEACRLLVEGTCSAGKTCAVVDSEGTTSCVNAGPARAGQDCERTRCAEGLTCLGQATARRCFKLCHVNAASECGANERCKGSVQLFSDPSIGICE